MAAKTKKKKNALTIAPTAQRGSLVSIKSSKKGEHELAIVVSNDVQNEASEFILTIPLQKRTSRLKAPFSVDLGRNEGLRALHTARADWLTRVNTADVVSIERAGLPEELMAEIDQALKVALGLAL